MGNVAKETLYLDKDKEKVLKEGDPNAKFTLTVKGAAVSDEDIEKYGLHGQVENAAEAKIPENSIAISGAPDGKQYFVTGKEVAVEKGDDLAGGTKAGAKAPAKK